MPAMKKIFTFVCCGLYLIPSTVWGVAERTSGSSILDNEVAAIYGKACEEFKPGEPKSSARVRVIDKASFAAVDSLSMLDAFRQKVEPQDFNIVVYNLVDNAVEDLSVRTLKQNDVGLCVEVTGYISKRNVTQALKEAEPQEEKIVKAENTHIPTADETMTEENVVTAAHHKATGKISIFIKPTEFYNNTSSDKFVDIIGKQFNVENIELSSDKENVDYIIQSNVLRAKVDPINSDTNRLQMVVAVELADSDGNRISTEHQNRFVLFSAQEDEQEVALRLMKKLFENACERILQKIVALSANKQPEETFAPIINPGGREINGQAI